MATFSGICLRLAGECGLNVTNDEFGDACLLLMLRSGEVVCDLCAMAKGSKFVCPILRCVMQVIFSQLPVCNQERKLLYHLNGGGVFWGILHIENSKATGLNGAELSTGNPIPLNYGDVWMTDQKIGGIMLQNTGDHN